MADNAHTTVAAVADHDEYDCPGCRCMAEYRIVADVYGCRAGRHCTQATLEQRIEFEAEIGRRIAQWNSEHRESQ